jgi:hypothetical protein
MDNEDVNLDIAQSLYATAKSLDPSRPVNTADGVWGATAKFANPQDFRSTVRTTGPLCSLAALPFLYQACLGKFESLKKHF